MRKIVLALLVLGIAGVAGPAVALQCVPYARQVSGLSLQGDAWRWWAAADGVYERGNAPAPGAVLVFKSTRSMRHGHVAVVGRVVNRREIRIDHANWGQGRARGQIDRDVAVMDVSPRNDWTQVRVWHQDSASYGARINPAFGFIYPAGRAAPPAPTAHNAAPSATKVATAKTAKAQTVQPKPAKAPLQAAGKAPKAELVAAATVLPARTTAPAKPAAPAKTTPEKATSAKTPPVANTVAARPGADDLNRLVLARLHGEGAKPAMAAAVGERPKAVRGGKHAPPQTARRAANPAGAKTKAAEKPRS